MTRDDILAMEPGRELDALVAEKVMGWKDERPQYDQCMVVNENVGGMLGPIRVFAPSTDISAAWEVVEKMHDRLFSRRKRFLDELQKMTALGDGRFIAWPDVFWTITPDRIVKAALLAVME
jgi:hypothetical protein